MSTGSNPRPCTSGPPRWNPQGFDDGFDSGRAARAELVHAARGARRVVRAGELVRGLLQSRRHDDVTRRQVQDLRRHAGLLAEQLAGGGERGGCVRGVERGGGAGAQVAVRGVEQRHASDMLPFAVSCW